MTALQPLLQSRLVFRDLSTCATNRAINPPFSSDVFWPASAARDARNASALDAVNQYGSLHEALRDCWNPARTIDSVRGFVKKGRFEFALAIDLHAVNTLASSLG